MKSEIEVKQSIKEALKELSAVVDTSESIFKAGESIVQSLRSGGKAMFCGNGGSAAHAQHLATELMGKFLLDRKPLPALSLTVDTSALTAIGNDYGYNEVFARQLRGVGKKGDVLVALSTSGNSKNILTALKSAKLMGVYTVGITGPTGGEMADLCDICIKAPSGRTDRIQNAHMIIGHALCDYIEQNVC